MTEGQAWSCGKREEWFGFLVSLPVFLQVQGSLGLYAEPWSSAQGIGLPLGFLAAAVLLLADFSSLRKGLPLGFGVRVAGQCFFVWTLGLAGFSAVKNPVALLYGLQWLAPLGFLAYGAVVAHNPRRLGQLLFGLGLGTAFSLAYLVVLGCVELAQDSAFPGRITQNQWLPGMYQLYNYVPVSLTLASLFCAGLCAQSLPPTTPSTYKIPCVTWLQRVVLSKRATWYFLFAGASIPLLTGARDPALLFLFAAPLTAWRHGRIRALVFLTTGCVVLVLGLYFAADGNLLLVQKLTAMFSPGQDGILHSFLGNRLEIMGRYASFARHHPWVGSAFLPPWIADSSAGIVAKSAHNYYLDTLVWVGPVGLLALLALFGTALRTALMLLRKPPSQCAGSGRALPLLTATAYAAAAPTVGLLLLSSNLRTPLREPISAMWGGLLLGFTLAWAFSTRKD